MGKKSRTKGKSKSLQKPSDVHQQCASCKNFVLESQVITCTGCKALYCIGCADFISCSSDKCNSPALCEDCAFGDTFKRICEANKECKKPGEPTIECPHPDFICDKSQCFKMLCFDCAMGKTRANNATISVWSAARPAAPTVALHLWTT